MAVLVVDTDRRRRIPSEFIWVMQGLAKRAKELHISREPAETINGSRRNRNVKSSSVKSRAADYDESRHAFDGANSYWSIRRLTGVPIRTEANTATPSSRNSKTKTTPKSKA